MLKRKVILKGLQNASYLSMGNFASQIVSFFGMIYIARLLGPDDYGIYVLVGAFVGLVTLFGLTGIDKVVLREGSKDIQEMHISIEKMVGIKQIAILFTAILCFILTLFTPYNFQVQIYIIVYSLTLYSNGMSGFFGTIFQASEKMYYIAFFNFFQRFSTVLLSILALNQGYGLSGLFFISICCSFLTFCLRYIYSQKIVKFKLISRPLISMSLLRPAITFSLIVMVGSFAVSIDLVMLSILGTTRDVGIYGIAHSIGSIGLLMRNQLANAFFPITVKLFQDKSVDFSYIIKISISLFSVIFLSVFIFTFYVDSFISFFFGSEYAGSGVILSVLLFYLCFEWASIPFTNSIQATYNEKIMLYTSILMALINIPLNYILFLIHGPIGIAYSTLVVFGVGALSNCSIGYYMMKKQGFL